MNAERHEHAHTFLARIKHILDCEARGEFDNAMVDDDTHHEFEIALEIHSLIEKRKARKHER